MTVTGTNFTHITTVMFGTTPGTSISVLSSTKLTVVAPAHTPGTVDVRVANTGGTSAIVAADRYAYTLVWNSPGAVDGLTTMSAVSYV